VAVKLLAMRLASRTMKPAICSFPLSMSASFTP
jgi:hypothetical protein